MAKRNDTTEFIVNVNQVDDQKRREDENAMKIKHADEMHGNVKKHLRARITKEQRNVAVERLNGNNTTCGGIQTRSSSSSSSKTAEKPAATNIEENGVQYAAYNIRRTKHAGG